MHASNIIHIIICLINCNLQPYMFYTHHTFPLASVIRAGRAWCMYACGGYARIYMRCGTRETQNESLSWAYKQIATWVNTLFYIYNAVNVKSISVLNLFETNVGVSFWCTYVEFHVLNCTIPKPKNLADVTSMLLIRWSIFRHGGQQLNKDKLIRWPHSTPKI